MFLVVVILISCKEEQKVPIVVATQPIETPDVVNYVFVTIKTEEPNLIHYESRTTPVRLNTNTIDGLPQTEYETRPEVADIKWIENMRFSKIIEVRNFTEDDKYKLMDDFESVLLPELDMAFQREVRSKVSDFSKRDALLKTKTAKISRNVQVFDSYAEASKNKNVLSQIWKRSVENELTGKPMNIEYNE